MKDNIVDFNDKKEKVMEKKVLNNFKDIADMVIEACFANGNNDINLAKDLLFETRAVDDKEKLRNTILSMTIETIERKGYWMQANKLREMLNEHLDHQYEKILNVMRNNNSYTIDKQTVMDIVKGEDDVEVYDDSEEFFDSLSDSEKSRILSVIRKLFKDEIKFSEMTNSEAFEILKECAKHSFYCGLFTMQRLVINNKRMEISLTFREGIPLIDESKDAFAYLVNIFHEMSITKNSKRKTITAHFSFHDYKGWGK